MTLRAFIDKLTATSLAVIVQALQSACRANHEQSSRPSAGMNNPPGRCKASLAFANFFLRRGSAEIQIPKPNMRVSELAIASKTNDPVTASTKLRLPRKMIDQ